MLTPSIADRYNTAVQQRTHERHAECLAGTSTTSQQTGAAGRAIIFSVPLDTFAKSPALEEEIFGPTTLLVHYGEPGDLVDVANRLHGHLTATIHGTEDDLRAASDLLRVLETKVGRLLFNGYPTGVEVSPAMVHGGPFPATSDGRSTSVGTRAILRFARPVCYQDFPDATLPPALRGGNPLTIQRMVNGTLGRD
jgi:NADP-dependent aldehyde dehydrogenase